MQERHTYESLHPRPERKQEKPRNQDFISPELVNQNLKVSADFSKHVNNSSHTQSSSFDKMNPHQLLHQTLTCLYPCDIVLQESTKQTQYS